MSAISCSVKTHITQEKASQKALDLVDVSVAYFCRISSFILFYKQLMYLQKYSHSDDEAPELQLVATVGIRSTLSSVAIIRMC